MNELKILEQLDPIEKLMRASKTVKSLEEASEYTGISRSYLYKLTAKGDIDEEFVLGFKNFSIRPGLNQTYYYLRIPNLPIIITLRPL